MENEQIKQNAEKYADSIYDRKFQNSLWKDKFYAYIADAYSRDEEIEILKHQLNNTSINLKIARAELDKLHNPWISVEDRLPENAGVVVIVLTDMGDIFNSFLFRNKRGSLIWNSDKGIGKPIFWMPIPQIEKGE